ncbi:hypothetical protein B566_EDAN003750 [Ephemera danica]|nr:hypothetical protein B566_EDAN003750 [Ephemera danica]
MLQNRKLVVMRAEWQREERILIGLCKAEIIDGLRIAKEIQQEIKLEIDQWLVAGHRRPQLTAILVGDDAASSTYVRNKMKAAENVGINSKTLRRPALISENELLDLVTELNVDPEVDGILVQLPLPEHITERAICNAVVPHKDVDGFNIVNVGIETFGKNAVVCGRSKNVGMPIAMLLHADGTGETAALDATTTICHRFTPREQLANFTRLADIIVSAAGVPNLIQADMVKPGACIIDVGITRIIDSATGKSKLVGDVDFESVSEVAGHITPVPGGVGPMTVTMLMKNTLIAAQHSVIYNIRAPGAVMQKKASQIRP